MVETYLFAIERNGAVRKLQKQGFNNIPSTGGLMARLVSARIMEAGIELKPLLKKAGLNLQQIEERSARIDAQNQVRFVNLAAEALRDDLLGFNLARSFDLREMGLLYYVLASAKSLGEAFPRVERYSRIANEGVSIRYFAGKRIKLTVD